MDKDRILEYFMGDPDTMEEFDDDTNDELGCWRYDKSDGISFGYFQTSLDGGKEFVAKENTTHYDLTQELGRQLVGKAIANDMIDKDLLEHMGHWINYQGAYKGRTFSKPMVITTWHKVSSNKLYEILELLGGVEKFMDYTYVYPSENGYDGNEKTDEGSINVIDYINSHDNYVSASDENSMKKTINNDKWGVPSWAVDIIRQYNSPSSKLADKTSKLGNMTIAQYNSLIHQEEKEPKKTIKENINNMKNDKYKEEFSNYISIMSEALEKNDYKAYEYVKDMLDEAIAESKHENELMEQMNTVNFGVLNHIFESELPNLIKSNKKAVKKVINTIKEDKNLMSEFNFYNVIKEQYGRSNSDSITSDIVLEKIAQIVCEEINEKTIKKSNKKLRDVMIESGIKPSEFINDEYMKLYENGNTILTTKRKSSNMIPLVESYDAVCKWMDAHKDEKKNGKDADEMIREFEEKLKSNLNEAEMSFVQQITDFRSPIAEQRKEKLFNKFKNECIDKINEMLKEDAENEELKGLSEQISEMKFNKESIVKDIAKLLEIRDILMDD